MERIVNGSARRYRSRLRAEQADRTRARILDAAVRVTAAGVADLSVPAVAREADVSVPTVYRHFGTKRDLLAAVHPHLVQRAGLHELDAPGSMEELGDAVRAVLRRLDVFDDLARAALASPASEEARQLSMPDRFEVGRRLVASIEPPLRPGDRDRIARLLTVVTTSSALRVWRDHLGVSVDDVVADIDWVVRAAVAGATSGR
jgi:AcrR family transcriptional regulator